MANLSECFAFALFLRYVMFKEPAGIWAVQLLNAAVLSVMF